MTASHLLVAHHKDPGRVRDYQEDDCRNFAIRTGQYHLLVVADGMGGHSHGEVASKMAIEALAQFLEYGTWDEPAAALRQGFAIANDRVYGQGADMGTTLTAVLFEEATNQYWWANVGDSRAYLLEGETLHQLSRDHSEIQVRVDAGQLTAEDARRSKGRNVLLKAIGPTERVEADVEGPHELVPGQRLLLCSDGLHGMLSEPELAAIAAHDLQVVAKDLVAAANVAGGRDNISALVAALSDGEATQFMGATPALVGRPSPTSGLIRRITAGVAAVGVFGLAVGLSAWALSGGGGGDEGGVAASLSGAADDKDGAAAGGNSTPRPSVEGTPPLKASPPPMVTPEPTPSSSPAETKVISASNRGESGNTQAPTVTPSPTKTTVPTTTPAATATATATPVPPTPTPPATVHQESPEVLLEASGPVRTVKWNFDANLIRWTVYTESACTPEVRSEESGQKTASPTDRTTRISVGADRYVKVLVGGLGTEETSLCEGPSSD